MGIAGVPTLLKFTAETVVLLFVPSLNTHLAEAQLETDGNLQLFRLLSKCN